MQFSYSVGSETNRSTLERQIMPLDFNYEKVQNKSRVLDDDGNIRPEFESVIYGMLGVGCPKLNTDKEIYEFAIRYELYQDVYGAPIIKFDENNNPQSVRIKYDYIKSLRGLTTNVPKKTWNEFMSQFRKEMESRVNRHVKSSE